MILKDISRRAVLACALMLPLLAAAQDIKPATPATALATFGGGARRDLDDFRLHGRAHP
jgi:hypothetical protein